MSAGAVPDPCGNCGAPLSGAAFCGGCGQKRARPLEVGRLLAEGVSQFASFENAWWTTLRELTLRPGPMVQAYVAGQRRRFINPIVYLLSTATVLLLAMHALDADILTVQAVDAAQRDNFAFILRLVGYLAVVGALPVAWLMHFALRPRTTGELYVLLVYTYGQLMLFQVLLYALGAASDPRFFIASRLISGLFFAWVFAGYFGWRPVRALLVGVATYAVMLGVLMTGGTVVVAVRTVATRLFS